MMQPVISIKWQDGNSKWRLFPFDDIAHMPKNHAINLFSGNIPVVAVQGESYIVNRPALQKQYQNKGKSCLLFQELTPSDKALNIVGLI